MKQYHDIVYKVLTEGQIRKDRTGTGTLSIFSHTAEYDLSEGFPLLTTKDMIDDFERIKGEMLWLLEGNTNAKYLAEKYGFKIWQKWQKDESGDLGRVYGAQWRQFRSWVEVSNNESITGFKLRESDQIKNLVELIKEDPFSRRMLVSAWQPAELDRMALPPCHWSFECYVDGDNMDRLNLKLHQRSCDLFLGVPYNIAEYSLLLHMLAQVTGLKVGKFVHDMTNVHIYLNHVDQMREQLFRREFPKPQLVLNPEVEDIFGFKMDDIFLVGYQSHGKLKGAVSV